jgi:hypothetical protein
VFVPMPEAAVHKYHNSMPRKHDVGPARKVLTSERKPKAQSVKQRPQQDFWASILTFDSAHIPASLFSCKPVHLHFPELGSSRLNIILTDPNTMIALAAYSRAIA